MFNLFNKKPKFNLYINAKDFGFNDTLIPTAQDEIDAIRKFAETSNAVNVLNKAYAKCNNKIDDTNADHFIVYAVLHTTINKQTLELYSTN